MILTKIDQSIFSLYLKNKGFFYISLILCLGAFDSLFSHPLDMGTANFSIPTWFRDTLFMSLFIFIKITAALLWPVVTGSILKSQFAHPRATLLPEFRMAHIRIFAFFYLIYLFLVFTGREYMLGIFDLTLSSGQFSITILFLSIGLLWLSYSFHHIFWCWVWIIWLACEVIKFIPKNLMLTIAVILSPFLFLLLIRRLMTVKEGMLEYSYLFTDNQNQVKKAYWPKGEESWGFFYKAQKLFAARKNRTIENYPANGSMWARAQHWKNYTLGPSFPVWFTGGVLAAMVIFLDFKSKNPAAVSGLSFFYIIMPATFVWGQFAPWNAKDRPESVLGHNLLKPFKREQLYKEIGIALLIRTLKYTFVLFISMEIVRLLITAPYLLTSPNLWSVAILALCLQLPLFAFEGCLYALTSKIKLVCWILYPMSFMLTFFMLINRTGMDFYPMMYISLIALIAGVLLSRMAYHLWYLSEIN